MRHALTGILAGACCVIVIACAAQHHEGTAPPPTSGMAPPPDGHARIEQLEHDIAAERDKLGLAAHVETAPPPVSPMATNVVATCARSESDRCHDTCTMSDTICKNADEICKIASGLPGDTWAADKCSTNRATCQDAQKACCDCH
ncbi:MAG TPA: hypothetical protein VLX92_34395 [Kofleriaceae bacterium]|nr:hypothetical protein [Kofleriaceae bacterium]